MHFVQPLDLRSSCRLFRSVPVVGMGGGESGGGGGAAVVVVAMVVVMVVVVAARVVVVRVQESGDGARER